MAEAPVVKRTRRGGPKGKNGCSTCKVRHVKCDERKPNCLNCTSSGRRCDGYQSSVISSRQLVLPSREIQLAQLRSANPWSDFQVTLAPALGLPGNGESRRLYHNFIHEVVPSLSESLDSTFWRTEILKNSASRPAVRHGAIAFGALYEQHLARLNDPNHNALNARADDLELLSSFWYAAAIQSLRDRISQSSADAELVEEAMMACLLFICIEILRGNDVAAVTHLEGALAIFRSRSAPRDNAAAMQTNNWSPTMTSAFQAVSKIFMRLDIQAVLYMGSRAPWFPIENLDEPSWLEDVPKSFDNLLEARDRLYFHLVPVLTFITPPHGGEQCFPGWTPHPDRGFDVYTIFHGSTYRDYKVPQASSQRRRSMKILSSWKSAYQGYLQKGMVEKPTELAECALLWLAFYTARIRLTVSYMDNECCYDDQLPQFKKIVEQAEIYRRYTVGVPPHASDEGDDLARKNPTIRPKKRDLSIHMGANFPLYYTVLKCRHKHVRQRALTLLQAGGTESIWDGQMLARIAEYVIEVEDATTRFNDLSDLAMSQRVPEANRIHCLSLNIDKASKRIWLQYNRRVSSVDAQLSQVTNVQNRWRIDHTILSW